MCGIIAVVSRPSLREAPTAGSILDELSRAVSLGSDTAAAGEVVAAVDKSLRGVPGVGTGGNLKLLWTASDGVACETYVKVLESPEGGRLMCRFTALITALNDAVTILASTPTPNVVGPSPTRSSA